MEDCGLTVGLRMGGFALGDAHDIAKEAIDWMDEGYYDLKVTKLIEKKECFRCIK